MPNRGDEVPESPNKDFNHVPFETLLSSSFSSRRHIYPFYPMSTPKTSVSPKSSASVTVSPSPSPSPALTSSSLEGKSDPVTPSSTSRSRADSASSTPSSADRVPAPPHAASIRELLRSVDTEGRGVVPLLAELADKHQQSSVLVQKAVLLLGLADKFKDTERGMQLKNDAEEFLTYAKQLQDSEEGHKVLEKAQAFADTVADKYERHGKSLFLQSQELWDDVMSSGEAKEFLSAGSDIVKDWKRWGGSTQGQELLDSLGNIVKESVDSKGVALLDLVKSYGEDATDFLANHRRHRRRLKEAAKSVKAIIEEDKELKEWVDKGSSFLKSKVGEGLNDAEAGLTDETLAKASEKGREALTKLKESTVGQDLLRKGTELLHELKDNEDLRPEVLVARAERLKNDPAARQEMLTKIKDAALEFLLQYLPSVKVPDLAMEDESKAYSLGNIDLSGFKVLSKDVDVLLTDAGINIRARNIVCCMNGLKWSYKSKYFPYISTAGVADSEALNVSFDLTLEVERTPRHPQSIPQSTPTTTTTSVAASSPSSSRSPSSSPDTTIRGMVTPSASPKVASSSSSSSSTRTPSSSTSTATPSTTSTTLTTSTTEESKNSRLLDSIFEYDYALVLVRSKYVTMPSLSVKIGESWLSGLYNALLSWFSGEVRLYVESQVNKTIAKQSGRLLRTINTYAKDYLPLFAKVKDKVKEKAPQLAQVVKRATRADDSDDDPEGAGSPDSPTSNLTPTSPPPTSSASSTLTSTATPTTKSTKK